MRASYYDNYDPQKTGKYNNRNERIITNERYLANTRPPNSETNMDFDGGTIGSILGGIFCFLLFLLIIFSIAYPLTMYRSNPYYSSYPDDKWWCYNCVQSWCASKCWYDNYH